MVPVLVPELVSGPKLVLELELVPRLEPTPKLVHQHLTVVSDVRTYLPSDGPVTPPPRVHFPSLGFLFVVKKERELPRKRDY